MRATSSTGAVQVTWNDQGDPCTISTSGYTGHMTDDDLRDLYACLEFLFGKSGP